LVSIYRGNIPGLKIKVEFTKKQIADLRHALDIATGVEHPGIKYRKLDMVIQRAIVRSVKD
jgi:hypothetical protein